MITEPGSNIVSSDVCIGALGFVLPGMALGVQ